MMPSGGHRPCRSGATPLHSFDLASQRRRANGPNVNNAERFSQGRACPDPVRRFPLLRSQLHGLGLLNPLGVAIASELELSAGQKGLMVAIPVFAGAGNSGTVLAALFAPGLAAALGWLDVVGLTAIPLLFALAVFVVLAKDSPHTAVPKRAADYLALLRIGDTWWFMFFYGYGVTFGGFVGLASSLTIYFKDQYGLSPVAASYCTAAEEYEMNMIAPRRQRLVVVGNGMAGVRTVEEILARAPDTFDITVFGAEPGAE